MQGEIRISADMEKRAGDYEQEAQKVEEVIFNMDRLLVALQDEWKGSAYEAYAERYGELRPSFERMRELIVGSADVLRSTARSIEKEDTRIVSQFK